MIGNTNDDILKEDKDLLDKFKIHFKTIEKNRKEASENFSITERKEILLLNGEWGTGKTYLAEQIIKKYFEFLLEKKYGEKSLHDETYKLHQKELESNVVYISLLGMKDKKDFFESILIESDKRFKESRKRLNKNINSILQTITSMGKELFTPPILDNITLEKTVSNVLNGKLLILDDLERISNKKAILDIFSFLSSLNFFNKSKLNVDGSNNIMVLILTDEKKLIQLYKIKEDNDNSIMLWESLKDKVIYKSENIEITYGKIKEFIKKELTIKDGPPNQARKELTIKDGIGFFDELKDVNITNLRFIKDIIEKFKNHIENHNKNYDNILKKGLLKELIYVNYLFTFPEEEITILNLIKAEDNIYKNNWINKNFLRYFKENIPHNQKLLDYINNIEEIQTLIKEDIKDEYNYSTSYINYLNEKIFEIEEYILVKYIFIDSKIKELKELIIDRVRNINSDITNIIKELFIEKIIKLDLHTFKIAIIKNELEGLFNQIRDEILKDQVLKDTIANKGKEKIVDFIKIMHEKTILLTFDLKQKYSVAKEEEIEFIAFINKSNANLINYYILRYISSLQNKGLLPLNIKNGDMKKILDIDIDNSIQEIDMKKLYSISYQSLIEKIYKGTSHITEEDLSEELEQLLKKDNYKYLSIGMIEQFLYIKQALKNMVKEPNKIEILFKNFNKENFTNYKTNILENNGGTNNLIRSEALEEMVDIIDFLYPKEIWYEKSNKKITSKLKIDVLKNSPIIKEQALNIIFNEIHNAFKIFSLPKPNKYSSSNKNITLIELNANQIVMIKSINDDIYNNNNKEVISLFNDFFNNGNNFYYLEIIFFNNIKELTKKNDNQNDNLSIILLFIKNICDLYNNKEIKIKDFLKNLWLSNIELFYNKKLMTSVELWEDKK